MSKDSKCLRQLGAVLFLVLCAEVQRSDSAVSTLPLIFPPAAGEPAETHRLPQRASKVSKIESLLYNKCFCSNNNNPGCRFRFTCKWKPCNYINDTPPRSAFMTFWLVGSETTFAGPADFLGGRSDGVSVLPPFVHIFAFRLPAVILSALCLYFIPIIASRTRTDSELGVWRESGAPMLPPA